MKRLLSFFASTIFVSFLAGAQEERTIGVVTYIEPDTTFVSGTDRSEKYGGHEFTDYFIGGPTFRYIINPDGVTVTLLDGDANGNESIEIPSSTVYNAEEFYVTNIKNFAFSQTSDGTSPLAGVKHIKVSEGIRSIGNGCFANAESLETVTLPSSLEEISYMMLANCPKLKSVIIAPESYISKIESFAFANCPSLERFIIPAGVTSIGEGPWRDCSSLKELEIEEGNYDFDVTDGVLYSQDDRLIQYPAGKNNSEYYVLFGTTSIGNSAFYGNPHIEKVIFPTSLKSISHIAFYDCQRLKELVFNSQNIRVGNKAFRNCPSLKGIILYGNPAYTSNDPADEELGYEGYNSFSPDTEVRVEAELPLPSLRDDGQGILRAAYDKISAMPHFYTGKAKKLDSLKFLKCMGKGLFALYGNAAPKRDVLRILESIPDQYLAYEDITPNDKITRIYIDPQKGNTKSIFFFGGTGGNDLIVVYFEKGNLKKMKKLIERMKSEKSGE